MKLAKTLLRHPYTLIFALFAGAAYYMAALNLLLGYFGGGFILFIFAPVIICGAGIIVIKTVKSMGDNENYRGIDILFAAHIALFIICALTLIARMLP